MSSSENVGSSEDLCERIMDGKPLRIRVFLFHGIYSCYYQYCTKPTKKDLTLFSPQNNHNDTHPNLQASHTDEGHSCGIVSFSFSVALHLV